MSKHAGRLYPVGCEKHPINFNQMAIIVHGPMACGKTHHSDDLRKFFMLDGTHDDWINSTIAVPGVLHLTYVPTVSVAVICPTLILSFDDAMKMASLTSTKGDC